MFIRMPRGFILPLLVALVLAGASPPGRSSASQAVAPERLQTPAEAVDYQKGGTLYGPLMDFVYELQSRTELMHVVRLTRTLGGRDMVLCVLSNPPVFQPSDLKYQDKPVVLIVNNVHGGEVAGKDAAMAIMRDLVMGDLRPFLDKVVVLVVPTINPDGAEVRRRTNDEGFDMNRDYLKLESQEIQAVVTKVLNEWNPHIHLDTHHGGAAPYTLVFQTNMNPAGDQNLTRYGNERILSRVRAALRAEDYDGFWYSGPGQVKGVPGWAPTSVEPRKQHVYSVLANSIGFLYETPSSSHRLMDNGTRVVAIPQQERYRHQVRGQYIGQRELIRFAADNAQDLMRVVAQARADAMSRGNDDSDNDQIPLEYEQVENFKDRFWRRVGGGGRGGGAGAAEQEGQFELVDQPVFTKWQTTRTTTRPWGYLFPNSLTKVIPVLLDHGITVMELTRPVKVEVETYYATRIVDPEYFQGHNLRRVTAEKQTETVTLPAGAFFVPSGQPKSNLVSYLFEPETNDNLVTWGYLDNLLRTTPSPEEIKAQLAAAMEEMGETTEEQRQQVQARFERQLQQKQLIPLYRLMKKTDLPGILVQPFNSYERNRYIR